MMGELHPYWAKSNSIPMKGRFQDPKKKSNKMRPIVLGPIFDSRFVLVHFHLECVEPESIFLKEYKS